MRAITLIFSLFTLFNITSCQVKEASSGGGGLISGHAPTTNKFTVVAPVSKTYVEADVIEIVVTYPFDIISDFTGGNPRLRITVGATPRIATFDSHPEPTKLVFRYTVQASELDSNGIDVNALELDGSTLQFDKQGVITNCDVSTVKTKNFPGAKVDTVDPTIIDFKLTNLPGLYNAGEKINFSMKFSEKVFVAGAPKFTMSLATGGIVDVNYVTGSGTDTLSFSYTVSNSVSDPNQYNAINSPIDLNTGSIKDSVGNDADLDFSTFIGAVITYSGNVIINGQLPYVINVVVPENGTYKANDDLDFILEFNRPVTLSGQPHLAVVIGANTREAHYVTGSGTELLTFRYTAVPGDVDPDGISITGSIVRNAGNIVDSANASISYFANALNNSFTMPNTTGIILNAIQPQAISITRNSDITAASWGTAVDNVWNIGQVLDITVGFNTQMFVTQTSGTPSITLNIGSTPREAQYVSGGNGQTSLLFRYTIQEGDLDDDGAILVGTINLNNGVITDAENTNTLLALPPTGLTNTRVDGIRPFIDTVASPTPGVYSQVAPLNQLNFVVTWSEAVRYNPTSSNLSLDIGGTSVNAPYATGNNSTTITHRPSSLAGRNDSDGVTISSPMTGTGIIRDQAGNPANTFTFSAPDTSEVLVDTTAPTITSIIPITSDGTYKAGDTLDFQVTFSESVTTTVSGGYPRIPVIIGSVTRYMVPTASKTDTIHNFRYTIQSPDLDTNGISLNGALQVNSSGHIRDAGRNDAVTTIVAQTFADIKVDAVVPTVSSTTFSNPRVYVGGEKLQITITYTEPITVDITDGTPFIAVDFDFGTDNYDYETGTGTNTLVFSRTLDSDHFAMNGLQVSVSAVNLNGGTMEDAGGNPAPTTFAAVNLSTTYVTYPEVKLWVKSNFVNLRTVGGVTAQNFGASTTESCGSGTCRSFTGDDYLQLNTGIFPLKTVFMALKTPATNDFMTTYNLFGSDLAIQSRFMSNSFDLQSSSGTIQVVGAGSSGLSRSTTYVLQADFTSNVITATGTMQDITFRGAIGEIIAVEGVLSATKKDNIRNYLDARY